MRIDTHVHIGGEAVGFHMNEAMVLEAMEKYKIDFSIVSNGDAGEMDHQQNLLPEKMQVSQEEALARCLAFARKYPDKIGAAPWVKPYTQGLTRELTEMMKKNRNFIYAIKLHPFHSNVTPTDERMLPYIELAEELNLPVVSHTGGCQAASSKYMYEVAKIFPKVNFVMVHMELGTDNKEAVKYLGKLDNLYGDTTWVPMKTTLEVVKRYGSNKMLFGSDMPIDGVDTYLCNPKGERSMYQDYFYELPKLICKEDYENIMYKNALKLFHIEQYTAKRDRV